MVCVEEGLSYLELLCDKRDSLIEQDAEKVRLLCSRIAPKNREP
jgi:hypothetical protein